MSQRGGSVVTYVRYGDKVYSPIIDKGEADYIVLSFELLEAARWTEYLQARADSSADQHPADQPHAGHHRRGGIPYGAGRESYAAQPASDLDAMDALKLR